MTPTCRVCRGESCHQERVPSPPQPIFDPQNFAFGILPELLHADSDVFFRVHEQGYWCRLCHTDFDTNTPYAQHPRRAHVDNPSGEHGRRWRMLQSELTCGGAPQVLSWCSALRTLQPKIERLPLVDQQLHVYSKVWDSMLVLRPAVVQNELRQAELAEMQAILALLCWRASCTACATPAGHTYSRLHWLLEGWKCRKADMRNCKAAQIVPRLVMPFLVDDDNDEITTTECSSGGNVTFLQHYEEVEFSAHDWAYRKLPSLLSATSQCFFVTIDAFVDEDESEVAVSNKCLLCDVCILDTEAHSNEKNHRERVRKVVAILQQAREVLHWRDSTISMYPQFQEQHGEARKDDQTDAPALLAELGKLIVRSTANIESLPAGIANPSPNLFDLSGSTAC